MRPRGFTLIEIVVVMLVLSVIITMAAMISRGVTDGARRKTTRTALENGDAALRQFVMVSRRLPCPADGALLASDPQAGRERRVAGACVDAQARGVLPWVTLGLPELLDGYDVRLTYRVGADLVADEALRMTDCDAAGDGAADAGTTSRCTAACVDGAAGVPALCTRPKLALTGRGLRIQSGVGAAPAIADPIADPPTGAAYILLSHGENRGAGYGPAGVVQAVTVGVLTAAELQNAAVDALKAYYVDDSQDDVMVRPSVPVITNSAGLGPRIHRPAGA